MAPDGSTLSGINYTLVACWQAIVVGIWKWQHNHTCSHLHIHSCPAKCKDSVFIQKHFVDFKLERWEI